jgi:hypothetical protein
MYETLIDGVKAELEEKTRNNDIFLVKGWSFNEKYGVCPVRCKYDNSIKSMDILTRSDICDKFKRNNIILCGWAVEVPENKYCDIQIKLENEWHTFLSFSTFSNTKKQEPVQPTTEIIEKNIIVNNINTNDINSFINEAVNEFKQKYPDVELVKTSHIVLNIKNKTNKANVLIINDFYENPDSVREIGLLTNPPINLTHFSDFTKKAFENILNKNLDSFTKYENKNKFELTTSLDPILINTGNSEYMAIVFLSPNPPNNSGITLYRSKHTKNMTVSDNEKTTVFQNGNQDITEFEPVDVIGNVYNRLVIFNSKYIHAISHNFGNNNDNGRLVQLFSFDSKTNKSDTTKIELNL